MLARCKATVQCSATMQALGLSLRTEPGKCEGVYYDGKGGLSRGKELGSLLDHAYVIKRGEHAEFEQQGSPLINYTITVHNPTRGRLLYIGAREANWLCILKTHPMTSPTSSA